MSCDDNAGACCGQRGGVWKTKNTRCSELSRGWGSRVRGIRRWYILGVYHRPMVEQLWPRAKHIPCYTHSWWTCQFQLISKWDAPCVLPNWQWVLPTWHLYSGGSASLRSGVGQIGSQVSKLFPCTKWVILHDHRPQYRYLVQLMHPVIAFPSYTLLSSMLSQPVLRGCWFIM